jgi:hypothetical protein
MAVRSQVPGQMVHRKREASTTRGSSSPLRAVGVHTVQQRLLLHGNLRSELNGESKRRLDWEIFSDTSSRMRAYAMSAFRRGARMAWLLAPRRSGRQSKTIAAGGSGGSVGWHGCPCILAIMDVIFSCSWPCTREHARTQAHTRTPHCARARTHTRQRQGVNEQPKHQLTCGQSSAPLG